MRKTPAGRSQGQEGGLRMQPRTELELQVLGRKNYSGGGTGNNSFLSEICRTSDGTFAKTHNPICNL